MRTAIVLACIAAVSASAQDAFAQAWPTRPIRFINPTAPGGTAEPIARVIAQRMSETLGQSVVVDSRGGAGGTVGTAMAANAPPDGYTILLGVVSPMAINVSLYGAKLPYDPLKSFAPISLITRVPQMLSVHPSVQATTIKQMGAPPESSTPAQLTTFLRTEIKKFAEVVEVAGAKID